MAGMDAEKAARNTRKHGVSFDLTEQFPFETALDALTRRVTTIVKTATSRSAKSSATRSATGSGIKKSASSASEKQPPKNGGDTVKVNDDLHLTPEMRMRPLNRRGRGRPASKAPKAQVTLRIDQDTLEHFKAAGAGWQSRINAALRKAAKR